MTAEQIRKKSAKDQKHLIEAAVETTHIDPSKLATHVILLVVKILVWGLSSLHEIAAQLAEINTRDTAAEARSKAMKEFIEAMQAEATRQSGLVVPGVTKR